MRYSSICTYQIQTGVKFNYAELILINYADECFAEWIPCWMVLLVDKDASL